MSTFRNLTLLFLGYLRISDMVKVGLPLSLIGALISMAMIHITGGLEWTFDIYNTCPDYLPDTAPCKVAPIGGDALSDFTVKN